MTTAIVRPMDNALFDAFGKLRVSMGYPVFSSKFEYSKNSWLWHEVDETGAPVTAPGRVAVHDQNGSTIDMPIPAVAGAKLIRQTRSYFPYQPGNSQRMLLTAVLGSPVAGIRKTFGYGDEFDGVFFRQEMDGKNYILIRSTSSGSFVEIKVPQLEWIINQLNDNLTNNPNGLNYDFSKATVLDVDLEWLGVGDVRVGVNMGRESWYLERFDHAGVDTTTYMRTACLPVRYEIENVTGVNTGSMKQICQEVASEGGSDLSGIVQPISTGATPVALAAGTPTLILAVRPRALFHGKANRVSIFPVDFSAVAYGNASALRVELLRNGGLTGTGWAPIDASADYESATEYATAALALSGTPFRQADEPAVLAGKAGTLTPGTGFIRNMYLNRGFNSSTDADADTLAMRVTAIGGTANIIGKLAVAEVY